MPIEFYLALMLLMGIAAFIGVVLVFRLANHDWPFDED